MGLNTKKIHGKDFLYFLYEKKSILLGPKGEYEKGNLENVKIAIERNDAKLDNVLQKYLDDVVELSHYMPEPERKEYLSKRSAELLARLRRLEDGSQKVESSNIAVRGIGTVLNIPSANNPSPNLRSHHSPSLDEIRKKLEESKKKKRVKKTGRKK